MVVLGGPHPTVQQIAPPARPRAPGVPADPGQLLHASRRGKTMPARYPDDARRAGPSYHRATRMQTPPAIVGALTALAALARGAGAAWLVGGLARRSGSVYGARSPRRIGRATRPGDRGP